MPDDSKARKSGIAAVEAALENAEAVTLDEFRAAVAQFEGVLGRIEASAHVTAAKDRLADVVQFVHAHFGVKA